MTDRIRRSSTPVVSAPKAEKKSAPAKAAVAPSPEKKGWAPKGATRVAKPASTPAAAAPVAAKASTGAASVGQSQAVAAQIKSNIDQVFAFKALGPGNIPESLLPTNHPPVEGNKTDFLVDGAKVFPQLLKDLSGATDSIHISHFAVGDDKLGQEMGKILMEKARSGVEVRVMMDPAGSGDLLGRGKTEDMLKTWEKAGVQVIRNFHIDPFRKAEMLNHPEHRKFYIIDGKTAYTGGMGIQEKYRSQWHDTMIRVEGEGSRQMQVDFLKQWQHMGGHIDQKGGSDDQLRARFFPEPGKPGTTTLQGTSQIPGESPKIREAYLKEINAATKSFYAENPYFTDARIISALEAAAKRGVDVRVVVPGTTDMPLTKWAARGEYDTLLKAGVKMYEYNGMTHAKVAMRDGEWSTTGSCNLDSLSMNHLYEFNYQSTTPQMATQIQDMIKADMGNSKEIKAGDVHGIGKVLGKLLNTSIISYFL